MNETTTKQLAGLLVLYGLWALSAAGWLLVGLGLVR
jgi:hypothetical protein